MHLDRQGMPICSETLVGRTTHNEGHQYITTFRHDFDSTQCSIPYSYQIQGTRRYDTTVPRLQVGCISDTETTTPKQGCWEPVSDGAVGRGKHSGRGEARRCQSRRDGDNTWPGTTSQSYGRRVGRDGSFER